MPPTKPYTGPTVVIDFDVRSKSAEVLGAYRSMVAYAWSGHPRPVLGERWECIILSQWSSGDHGGGGVLVQPLRLLRSATESEWIHGN